MQIPLNNYTKHILMNVEGWGATNMTTVTDDRGFYFYEGS